MRAVEPRVMRDEHARLAMEREVMERRGAWGEQPDEPPCVCPDRPCWCQEDGL